MAGVDVENAIRELPDEVNIVGDEHQSAFVGFESQNEGLDCENVEVSGWLIHQENVWGIDEELDEVEAGFFATAEDGGFFEDVVALEKEGTKDAAGFVLSEGSVGGEDFIEEGVGGIERGSAVLAEVADLGIAAVSKFAFLELDFAGKDFEEGGFAGAVRADEGDAFATLDLEVEAAIDDMIAVGHVDAFK